jgi:hypothetical protein
VTSGTNPTTLGGYGITDAAALSGATFTGPIAATAETGNTISGSSLSGIGVYGSSEVIGLSGQSVDGFGGTFGSINNTALLASTNIGTGIVALSVDGTGIDASSINGVGLKIASTASIPLVATLNNSAGTIAQFYNGSNKVCSILASGSIQLAANSTGSRTLTLVAPTSSTFNRTITFPSASGTVALAATTLAGYGITDAVSSTSLSDHISDETKHLTSAQNTLIDAITVTSTEINHLTDVTSNVQSQINSKSSTAHTHDNATTVIDGFMSAGDKTKLDAVQSGAEVNVNSDWNAASGDAQILNKPTTLSGYGITDAAALSGAAFTGPISATNLGTISSKNYTQSATAPSSPTEGDQWFRIDTLQKYEYYNSEWVSASGTAGADGAPGPIGPSIESLIITESTTARTLALTDTNQYIRCTNVSQTTITVPLESSVAWTAGAVVYFRRDTSAGAIQLLAASGVTINNFAAAATVLADNNFAIKKVGTNIWDFI